MAVMRQYLTSSKNLGPILAAIRGGEAPDRFTQRFLESLGFKSTSDRLSISVLKGLGFLKESGEPTERYIQYLDGDQSKAILGDAIREAYSDLFRINKNAQKMSKAELKNKFKTLTEGKAKESIIDKMAMTFLALCNEATFSGTAAVEKPDKEDADLQVEEPIPANGGLPGKTGKISQLAYNIQIHLPASREASVYEAIFKALKEHLL